MPEGGRGKRIPHRAALCAQLDQCLARVAPCPRGAGAARALVSLRPAVVDKPARVNHGEDHGPSDRGLAEDGALLPAATGTAVLAWLLPGALRRVEHEYLFDWCTRWAQRSMRGWGGGH